jgi:uncharacterized membrane protein
MSETVPPSRQWRFQPIVLRLLALVGLGVSSALMSDAVFGVGIYCGANNSCAEVAESRFGEVAGVPLSAIGLAAFAIFLVITLVSTAWARTAIRVLAVVAGLAGVCLLVIQLAVLHRICPLCVAADASALGMAVVALVRRLPTARPRWLWVQVFVWLWAGIAAVMVPLAWAGTHMPGRAPDPVRALWIPGKITVVEVTDFDCPACQRADPVVRAWLRQHDVHFVRLVSPMQAHEFSRQAGAAYLAALRQGKGEEMAEALYASPTRDPIACRTVAEQVGLDLARYDKDVKDPALEMEMNNNVRWVKPTDLGLPFFWIQDELLVGVQKPEDLDAALARAKPAP